MNIHKFILFKNIFIILINYNYLKYLLFIYLFIYLFISWDKYITKKLKENKTKNIKKEKKKIL